MKRRLLLVIAAFGLCLSAIPITPSANIGDPVSDWPQWRGPNREGVSQEKGMLKQWPAGGPKLAWQVNDVGDGYSTPSVVGIC
jgi:outer membrane protein assembly factor BamB